MQGYSIGNLGEALAANDTNPDYFPVPGCKTFGFTVLGTFVATVKVQGSVMEKPDKTNADHWFDLISVSAKGTTIVVDKPCRHIRRNVSGYASGLIDIHFVAS